jgi:hypothetical protein
MNPSPMQARKDEGTASKRGRSGGASHALAWLLMLLSAVGGVAWTMTGRAYVRRRFFGVPPIPEASRTESRFLAVLLPRISPQGGKFGITSAELTSLLDGLKAEGYVSVGLDDVQGLYFKGRPLPPKALLVAFAQDDPEGVGRADAALREARWRGVVFITRTAASAGEDQRQLLTDHALRQMSRGAAWDVGAISQADPPAEPQAGGIRALLDDDGRRPAPRRPGLYPLRFTASELGYNDADDAPGALNILALRPGRGPGENLRIVSAAWPRESAFADDFGGRGLGPDWITGWGAVSAGNRRLALLPTPRQTGAGVFLRGTERWRDVVLEFNLQRYDREFWAYARYNEDGSFVRVGARNGYWCVEQKIGSKNLPTTLARAPMIPGSLPAHVRFVLKEASAIVHVNGRMQFGRSLRVDPAVAHGRVLFGVYDARQRSAFAIVTSVKVRPAGREWITWKDRGGRSGFDENRLEDLREEAVYARAFSPHWIIVKPDGGVAVNETQGGLLRSLAGFYGCRLIPLADLPATASLTAREPSSERLADGLTGAVLDLGTIGLNLRVRGASLGRPQTARFLARLGANLHAHRRGLWLTVDGAAGVDPAVSRAIDGVLRPGKTASSEFELLESPQTRASGRPQWETAFNR